MIVDVRFVCVLVFTEVLHCVLLTIIFNMPQPKWYGKSLSALCMDSIVDNMEKWTALRSSEHVFYHFHLLRECLWNTCLFVGYCYNYFITAF